MRASRRGNRVSQTILLQGKNSLRRWEKLRLIFLNARLLVSQDETRDTDAFIVLAKAVRGHSALGAN
jgi:hypothetical protein